METNAQYGRADQFNIGAQVRNGEKDKKQETDRRNDKPLNIQYEECGRGWYHDDAIREEQARRSR